MQKVTAQNVTMHPSFIRALMDRVADKMIPYQWEALNDRIPDADPSYCIRNFKAAAHLVDAPHAGCVFQDSDLAKWLEAASYMLLWRDDPETEKNIDEVVEIMRKAQMEDGYLDTYYQLNDIDQRFTNLRDNHELYCAGHLLEAAVAYFDATGKRAFLDIMLKYVDLIDATFGSAEGKKHGYPGHEEIELALVKLYGITHDPKHLNLAKYFIDERGSQRHYFDEEAKLRGSSPAWAHSVYERNSYYQASEPVRSQMHALGHAVRQVYLLTGMAEVARETNDESLKLACKRMWNNITRKQMYITGAVGQTAFGEAFTYDFDLPNDTVYGETCASIAMFFFAQSMLRLETKGEYGDIMDTMLYNGTISGMNLEGNRFFYVNPLECIPERSEKSQIIRHIKPVRQKWFGCACCPPNLARMITSLPSCIFTSEGNSLYMNLYTCCDLDLKLDNGRVTLSCETDYPQSGLIRIKMAHSFDGFALNLRLPAWVRSYELRVNGEQRISTMDNGYVALGALKDGDEIVYELHMPVDVVRANPRVSQDAGLIAIRRGPMVYCLEEIDNGANLANISISPKSEFTAVFDKEKLGGITEISCPAKRISLEGWDEYELYASNREPIYEDFTARFVPYYSWNNRGKGEMRVWIKTH